MSDFSQVTPLHLHFQTRYGPGHEMRTLGNATAVSAQNWTTNLAVYTPMVIPWPYPVKRVWWFNGSTITSSHADFGIYTPQGAKIYSTGSTSLSGASATQYVTPGTPFILEPGAYYFAYWCDNTTARTTATTATAPFPAMVGFLSQASLSSGLPASATFAAHSGLIPFCGVTRTGSGF